MFWFPLVTDEFCEDMIVMMEHFGDWSAGRNNNSDKRLPGGYENVPTVDIHTKQINWDSHWLFFLEKVMMPMQRSIFTGYVKSVIFNKFFWIKFFLNLLNCIFYSAAECSVKFCSQIQARGTGSSCATSRRLNVYYQCCIESTGC